MSLIGSNEPTCVNYYVRTNLNRPHTFAKEYDSNLHFSCVLVDEAKTSRGFQTLALHGEYSTHAVKEIEFQKTTDFPGGVKILVSLL